MVKTYSKYEQSYCFATVTTPTANVLGVTDAKGKLSGVSRAIVAANEEVLGWNVKKGELLSRWRDSENKFAVTVLTQSRADPDVFAVGYDDGTIRVWDSRTDSVLIHFNGHKSAVTTLHFDDNGARLASGAKDTDIIIWDLVAEVGLFRLRGHKDRLIAVHWLAYDGPSPGATSESDRNSEGLLLSISKDAVVKLWDVASQRCIETHLAHTNGECWALGVSNDTGGFVTAGIDGEMKVWSIDLTPLQPRDTPLNGTTPANCLRDRGLLQRATRDRAVGIYFHPSLDYFAVHGTEKSLEIWRIRTEEEVMKTMLRKRKRQREKSEIARDGLSNDVSESDSPKVTDYFTLHMILRPGGKMRSAAWMKSRSTRPLQILVTLNNNQIEVFDIPNQGATRLHQSDDHVDYTRVLTVETPGHRTDIRSLALSSDDRMLGSASNGTLKVWNVKTGHCLRTLDCGYALCCAFLPGDKIVVVGTKSGEIELFDVAASTLIEKVQAHDNAIWTLKVHPHGKSLVTGSADKTAKFWEFSVKQVEITGTRRKLAQLQLIHSRTLKLNDDILSLCFSPDARLLAVSTLDNTVKVFFVDSLKLFLNLYGHKLPVLDISISGDSKIIATCSADKNVRLWGLDFGDCHRTLFGHNDSVMQVSFIPHPSTSEETHCFFSASKDRTIKTWDGDKFEQIQRLDGHFGEIWTMAVSRAGAFIVTAAHDKSIRIWTKTDEPIFLEEEREKEMEALYESTLAATLGTSEPDMDEHEAQEAVAANKATIATLTAGERIFEALKVGLEDLQTVEEWELQRSRNPHVAPPQRDPLFTALGGISAERHVLNTFRKIPSSQLQDALLTLPFSVIPSLLTFLQLFSKHQWDIALVCRVLFFILKTHHRQIVASRELKTALGGIRKCLRAGLESSRQVMGFNLAALSYAESGADERRTKSLEDIQTRERVDESSLASKKKRAFIDVA